VLAVVDVPELLADLGSGDKVESWVVSWDIVVEQAQDDISLRLWHGSGGKVADQTAVALVGLVVGDGGDHDVGFDGRVGGSLSTSSEVVGNSGNGGSLEEKGTSSQDDSTGWGEESSGSGGGAEGGQGDGSAVSGTDG